MLNTLLAFDPSVLATFVFAGLLLNFTPGADFLFITASGINGGARVGRAAGVGICAGILVHVLMAAAGVSALLLAYPSAYTLLKIAGAAYLLFIAYRSWRDSSELGEGDAALSSTHAIKRGFLTNVLNPKTALFIFAFIPQFTDERYGPLWQQILILGFIFLFNGFVFAMILATAAGYLSPLLRRHMHLLNKLTAVLFVLLALRLVL